MTHRLLHSQKQSADLLGISVNHFKAHVRPHLRATYIGSKVGYSQVELDNFVKRSTA
jgi:hypothetical protein